MARKDALLRLHKRLAEMRDSLRIKLAEEMEIDISALHGGDVGDAASDDTQNELNTQLAALESRELAQIERAMHLIRDGRYGTCEACDGAIPIARLQALPFTVLCVECQRVQELRGGDGSEYDADWESAYELEGRMSEKELTLGDFDLES